MLLMGFQGLKLAVWERHLRHADLDKKNLDTLIQENPFSSEVIDLLLDMTGGDFKSSLLKWGEFLWKHKEEDVLKL